MNPAVASAIVTTIGVIVVGVLTYRQNRKGAAATNALNQRANELAERVVDREDFETIVAQLRTSLADVRTELAQVKEDLAAEVKARREAETRAADAERRAEAAERRAEAAERRAGQAERRATRLELRVGQLERVLRDAQIPVPPVGDEPDLD